MLLYIFQNKVEYLLYPVCILHVSYYAVSAIVCFSVLSGMLLKQKDEATSRSLDIVIVSPDI